ncbi:NAD(P)/FAD-dependent oxidoreductase [Cytobacillus horneckiae]|uniref:Sarcosine oxidase subunit alpha n=1 Tax=Cytobacillus horneckiae TaxID=549687 RepID=A0A2N0ZG74_9BACI|nr:FAD-dependent oxidoreductase [Cytobacillus horneckiae]MEC1155756.1 FAD-dependent oxidoreductase [Cytobacillus horneckiae]MED2939295.1 FAD-dependent oxidoreductase [Cytobacillus horneckiae]PKG28520.1 sarcosine oxidase subunit alpha [Cytobacillus horneckiae]
MSEILIIGAGPAGLSGAIACAQHGLKVTIIDEFIKPGGRLLGQLHQEPSGEWWNGMKEAEKLINETKTLPIDIRCGVSVYNIERHDADWYVYTNEGVFESPYVLIATGAAEYAIPVPGWTLPGVMSIGASQVMTNVHRVQVGKKGIIIGANVLAFAILNELQMAGINIERVVLPAESPISKKESNPEEVLKILTEAGHLAPSALLRNGSKLMKIDSLRRMALKYFPKGGMKINGTPLQLKKAAIEIVGNEKVEGVKLATIDSQGNIISGTEKLYEADFVCIAGGLYPLAELAAVAGCPFKYIPQLGGHVPIHSKNMETPIPGMFVAGNITGIESGKIAMAQGTVAGLAIAMASQSNAKIDEQLQQALQKVEEVRTKSPIQFIPEIAEGRLAMERVWEKESNRGELERVIF